MTVMENETWPHSSYIPHYLLRGDPFASKLSREADIVAAFYICIIGQSVTVMNALSLALHKYMLPQSHLLPLSCNDKESVQCFICHVSWLKFSDVHMMKFNHVLQQMEAIYK